MSKDEDDPKDLPVHDKESERDGKQNADESKQGLEVPGHQIIAREMSSFIAQSGPRHHPIFDKFEPEHVSQFLNNAHENQTQIRRQESSNRNYALVYFFTFIVTFVGIFVFLAVLLLPDNTEIFFDILTAVGSFIAGGFGGYGFHAYIVRKRE